MCPGIRFTASGIGKPPLASRADAADKAMRKAARAGAAKAACCG
jgi:hypothetical protein